MNDGEGIIIGWCLGFLVGSILAGSVMVGYFHSTASDAHAGHWEIDANSGKYDFVWGCK